MQGRNRRKKFMFGVFAIAALLIGLGAQAQNPVEVEFWSPFTGPDGEAIEVMVEDFNSTVGEEEGVTVNMLIVPWDDYYTKLTVALASGRAPNLAIAHSHRIAGFVEEGALTPFSPEDLEAADIQAENYIPALWNAGSIEGTQYAVPIDAFPRHLYYNKALFEEAGLDPENPPQNREELIDAAQKIAELGDDTYGVFFRLAGSWVARDFYTIYWQFTDDLLASDMQSVSPDFEEAASKTLNVMTSLINEYEVAPAQDIEEYETFFLQNRIGIVFSQITELALFSDAENLEYGVAPFPQIGDQRATFALGHNFILPPGQGEDELAASLVFIEWISKNSLEWARSGKIPASFAVIESPEFAELEDQSIVASQLDYMKLPPAVAEQPMIDQIVQETIEQVYAGQLSVDDAVSRMATQINEALAN